MSQKEIPGGVKVFLDDTVQYVLDEEKKTVTVTAKKVAPPAPAPTVPAPTPTPKPPVLGTVAVVNNSTNVTDTQIQSWIDAVKIQADRDISKWWTYSVDFLQTAKGDKPARSDWYCGFFDTSDVANAAGWHDQGPFGEPLIKVFTVNSGEPSVTFSHEIVESISDTNANTTVRGFDDQGKPCMYYRESADPVENNTYQINGIDVSDFITPQWFIENSKGPWDFLNATNKPYQVLPGGYMQLSYDNGTTWTEIDKFAMVHQAKFARKARPPIASRYELYKKPVDQRVKSTFTLA